MFGKKKQPIKYETAAEIDIKATPQQVFAVLDPSSPDYCLSQEGSDVEIDADNQDSFIAFHPSMPDEQTAIAVTKRIAPESLEVCDQRLSHDRLIGYLLGTTNTYVLSPSDAGGTTVELSTSASFHPKATGAMFEMEQQMYNMAIISHLEKVRSFCELPPEQNEYHVLYGINKFWSWFVDNEQPLRTADIEDSELLDQLGEELQGASQYLSFELRMLDEGIRELAIHADGMKSGFSAVKRTVALAPVDTLPAWRVVAFKQPKGALPEKGMIDSVAFDPRSIRYMLEPLNEFGTRDITLYFDTYTRRTREEHMGRCFFVLDHCLGEYVTATAIGEIELAAAKKAGADAKPIDLLASEFN